MNLCNNILIFSFFCLHRSNISQSQTKWYWQDDKGGYNPIDGWLCKKLNDLVIGDIMKQKIKNSMYEFKITNIGKGQQRNLKSNKIREIRTATYGWYFEDNDKSLKPFNDKLNKRLDSIQINASFTFNIKTNKYLITKLTKNTAKQKNLSSNFERNVVLKMSIGDDHNDYGGNFKGKSNGDWLQKIYTKAMKTGKIERVKLTSRRNLKEDEAESHFRRCESQFMRSCQNLGGAANGLNKTITEVEYIINPKLIKKFEAKKKVLMKQNKCGERGLNIILAWHGTKSGNVKSITDNNFSLAKLAANTGNKGFYGCGIYFSEFAKISSAYGDGLLLCKVMLGKQYQMNASKTEMGRQLEPGHDSHVVVNDSTQKYGQEIVIFDVDQILPCYVVKY